MTLHGCVGVACALAAVQLLFLGPAVALALAVAECPPAHAEVASVSGFFRYFGHRLYVRDIVLAPLLEEVIYRSCICSILLCAHRSLAFVVFVAPLFFGVSHVHHLIEGARPLQVRIGTPPFCSPPPRSRPVLLHVPVRGTLLAVFR